jgi:hypothetical protein
MGLRGVSVFAFGRRWQIPIHIKPLESTASLALLPGAPVAQRLSQATNPVGRKLPIIKHPAFAKGNVRWLLPTMQGVVG